MARNKQPEREPMVPLVLKIPTQQDTWLRARAEAEGRTTAELVRELIGREMRATAASVPR